MGDPQLLVSDRIVEVNGVSGDAEQLLAEMTTACEWNLRWQWPAVRRFDIPRGDNGNLGLSLAFAPNGITLCILDVKDGPVKEWNDSNGAPLHTHDRIVEMNGVRGPAEELLKVDTAGQLN